MAFEDYTQWELQDKWAILCKGSGHPLVCAAIGASLGLPGC